MTKDQKLIAGSIAVAVAFYLGWVAPWLWAVALLVVVLVLVTPTKADPKKIKPVSVPLRTVEKTGSAELDVIKRSLHEAWENEQNEDIKRGIQIALDIVTDHHRVSAEATIVGEAHDIPGEPPKSPEEIAKDKEKQELRNINTILYVASFLLVGAAAIFVGFTSEIDRNGKFLALLFITSAFYGVGMMLYKTMPKIRPAAIAFVGTGLALIPFSGLGLYNYILPDAALSWWITSIVGFVAFWVALLVIRAEVMSYLTLAFVFSLTTSSVAVLDVAFVWYFVAVIVTSSLMLLASSRASRLFPSELRLPLEQNAQLAAPLALIGSLLVPGRLELVDYVLVSGIGSLHYAVTALGYPNERTRYAHWTVARLLSTLFAALLAYYVTNSFAVAGVVVVISGLINHLYALSKLTGEKRETLWLWMSQGFVVVGTVMWVDDMWNVSVGLLLLTVMSTHQLMRMKRSEYAVGLLGALALLPLIIGRGALEPELGYNVLALWSLVTAVTFFAGRISRLASVTAYRQVAQSGYALFALEAVLLACINPVLSWTASIFIALAILVYYASFVERQPLLHIASNLLALVGAYLLLREANVASVWLPLATAWLLGLLWYALRWYHELYNDDEPDQTRIDVMFLSSAGILTIGALYSAVASDVTATAGSLTGLAVAALVAVEGRHRGVTALYEVALMIATLSLQWLVHKTYPEADLLLYTHWWALSTALIALLRFSQKDREGAKGRGIVALALVSVPTGLYALSDPLTYQYLFLLEHVALLVGGFLLQRKFVIRWSAIAIGLALLWMLSSFTYVLLAVIALGLMGLAIRRLIKQ